MFTKPAESPPTAKRPRKAPVACVACKVRKTRCSGTAPCETCLSLETKCIIDETLDGRRKVALNRRLEQLSHYQWILEGLLICLRTCRGQALVDVLECLLNDASIPSLAAAICSALAKCPVPLGQEKRFAELQQNLADYVRENVPAMSYELDNSFNRSTHEEHRVEAGNAGKPPLQTSRSRRALEKDSTKHSQYQPLDSSQLSHTRTNMQIDPLGKFVTFPDHVTAEVQSLAQDIGLDVIIEFLNASGMKPQDDLGQYWKHDGDVDILNEHTRSLEPDRKDSSLGSPCDIKSEWDSSGSKKPTLSNITIPLSHVPFYETPLSAVVPSSSTSSRRPSITPSTIFSSLAGHSPLPAHPFHAQKEQTSAGQHTRHYFAVPQIELDTQPMACAITSFIDLARTMLSQSAPIQEVFGPERAAVDLLFRPRRSSDPHSVCHFAAELCAGVKGIDIPAKLGMTFMHIYLLRWMILSSSNSYSKIPEMYRPTLMQTNTPHSAAVEFCPFPPLRDALCRQYRDFLPILSDNISCNWPYAANACVERDDATGHISLTHDFARHCLVAGNWTVRPALFDAFPECRGLIKTSI